MQFDNIMSVIETFISAVSLIISIVTLNKVNQVTNIKREHKKQVAKGFGITQKMEK